MTLRQIEIFTVVAEVGSMSEAARRLKLSQPTVSENIRELEAEYDILLFERLGKRLRITAAGSDLLAAARRLLVSAHEVEHVLNPERYRNRLAVGASETCGLMLMPDLLARYARQYPDLHTTCQINNTEQILAALRRGELDIAMVEGDIPYSDLIVQPYSEDHLVIFGPKGHLFFHNRVIRADDLDGERFVLREEGSGTRAYFERFMHRHQLAWDTIWSVTSFDSNLRFVESEHLLGVASYLLVREAGELGRLQTARLSTQEWRRTFNVVYHRDKVHTRPLEEFTQFLEEAAKGDRLAPETRERTIEVPD